MRKTARPSREATYGERMTKPRLTLEEHEDFGRTLAGIRDELQHRATQLANAYPRSGPEAVAGKQLHKVVEDLEQVRVALDNAVFREHPDIAETTVYYPHPENRSRIVPPQHLG